MPVVGLCRPSTAAGIGVPGRFMMYFLVIVVWVSIEGIGVPGRWHEPWTLVVVLQAVVDLAVVVVVVEWEIIKSWPNRRSKSFMVMDVSLTESSEELAPRVTATPS